MKDNIYRIVVDTWRLAVKYGFRKMGTREWESFISESQKLVVRYRPEGETMERLCRNLLDAFQQFYERL